jgi:hypothetical protein
MIFFFKVGEIWEDFQSASDIPDDVQSQGEKCVSSLNIIAFDNITIPFPTIF